MPVARAFFVPRGCEPDQNLIPPLPNAVVCRPSTQPPGFAVNHFVLTRRGLQYKRERNEGE
jgi:hypothetical protein